MRSILLGLTLATLLGGCTRAGFGDRPGAGSTDRGTMTQDGAGADLRFIDARRLDTTVVPDATSPTFVVDAQNDTCASARVIDLASVSGNQLVLAVSTAGAQVDYPRQVCGTRPDVVARLRVPSTLTGTVLISCTGGGLLSFWYGSPTCPSIGGASTFSCANNTTNIGLAPPETLVGSCRDASLPPAMVTLSW